MARRGADRLVRELGRHVSDHRVLEAIRSVPREEFVPPELRSEAWDNVALPIAGGQTISQPLVVARMCELLALDGTERVLDVGTGSGYHAAVLARLAAEVWSVERDPRLSAIAGAALSRAGIEGVALVVGDGTQGLAPKAPFDAINVAAATADVPAPLAEQLVEGGRLVLPLGDGEQALTLCVRTATGLRRTTLERVRFVPLVAG